MVAAFEDITRRKRSEKELERYRERLEDLDAFALDAAMRRVRRTMQRRQARFGLVLGQFGLDAAQAGAEVDQAGTDDQAGRVDHLQRAGDHGIAGPEQRRQRQ